MFVFGRSSVRYLKATAIEEPADGLGAWWRLALKRLWMNRHLSVIALASALALAACGPSPTNTMDSAALPDLPQTQVVNDIVPEAITRDARARLMAAAEPFETLTESAFDRNSTKVGAAIAKAQGTVPTIRPLLPADAKPSFDKHLAALDAAYRAGQRVDLAQASIEIYRILVTQGAGASRVPAAISLLDYAGFRYSADLKAKPIRWSDMNAATDFAKAQWETVSPRVADKPAAVKFSAAIDNMAASTKIKDPQRAAASAATELNLVDVLELSFNKP